MRNNKSRTLFYRIWMKFILWNMSWMTHTVPTIAKVITRQYADQEIIACGFRLHKNSVPQIMFSPEGKIDHLVKKVVNKKLLIIPFEPAKDFTSNLVKQVSLLQASTNDLYIIQGMNKNKTRIYFSPKILIKEETVIDNSLLEVKKNQESVSFHWSKAKKYRPMIYFLSLESTNEEHTRVGIYTRDTNWYYPNTRKIPLILNNSTMHIPASGHYQAKLVLVDFDGWVSHLATQKFSI